MGAWEDDLEPDLAHGVPADPRNQRIVRQEQQLKGGAEETHARLSACSENPNRRD